MASFAGSSLSGAGAGIVMRYVSLPDTSTWRPTSARPLRSCGYSRGSRWRVSRSARHASRVPATPRVWTGNQCRANRGTEATNIHRTGGPRLLPAESGVRMAERGEIPVLGRLLLIPRSAGAAGAIGGGAGAVLERGGRGGARRRARGFFGVAAARDRSSGRDSGG